MKNARMTALLWLLGFAAEAALLLFLTPVYTAATWITLALPRRCYGERAAGTRKAGSSAIRA